MEFTSSFPVSVSYGFYESVTDGNMSDRTIIDDPCSSQESDHNISTCKQGGLGLSLSTPILMLSSGLLGNFLALAVLYTSKKEAKKTVFYVFLAALAWTDLISQLLTGPIAIMVYANNFKWVGGKPLCKYHAFVMIFFGALIPLLVCAMSVERLLALRFTYFYARTITRRKAKIAVIGCWIYVFFFCTWPFMGLGSYELQFPGSWCFLNFHRETSSDMAYATVFSVINIVVIVANLCCNIAVVAILLKMRRKRIVNNSPSMERRHGTAKIKSSKKRETETQMVVFLCAITIVFTTCWLPLNVTILMNQMLNRRTDKASELLSVRFAGINQILDPWLYILLRKALIFKLIKRIKYYLWDKKNADINQSKALHSYDNVQIHIQDTMTLGTFQNLETRKYENDNCDNSNDSLSSTSNLLPSPENLPFSGSTCSDGSKNVKDLKPYKHRNDTDEIPYNQTGSMGTKIVNCLTRRHSCGPTAGKPTLKKNLSIPAFISLPSHTENVV